MANITKWENVEISKLRPYENNAKIHGQEQVEQIANSIKEFGFVSPCIVDKDFNLIAGHGRIEAAKKLGMSSVPCVFVEGLTEAQRKAYILADNRLTELGEWDWDKVSEELKALEKENFDINFTGFSVDDIYIPETEDILDIEDLDQNQEPQQEPRIKQGEIWQLGRHRLMCGDSTDPEAVQKLVDNNVIDLLETDPPYNVNVESSKGDKIENDNLPEHEFYQFLDKVFYNVSQVLKPGGAFYIWHASSTQKIFEQALQDNGMSVKQQLIWVKNAANLSRSDYHWRHEPCFYGWKDGAAHYFIDLFNQTTISETKNDLEKLSHEELLDKYKNLLDDISTVSHARKPLVDDLHPTMKPLSLIKRHIRNSSRENENVLDLFGGSGTTLIACEELNRKCFMMEYDPKYAEVIIQQWEEKTGKKAVKIN